MVDVLLAHSYFVNHDPKQKERMKPYPPLATLYAAANLRRHGYSVALFDAMLAGNEEDFDAALREHRPRFVVLYEDSFNFLVKMCLARMRQAAQTMTATARAEGATVIAAGPDVTDNPHAYFKHGAQYALVGEADHTLIELMGNLSGRRDRPLTEIDGLVWPDAHEREGVHRTPPREPERNLDCLPFAAWDLLDVERYREAWTGAHGYFSLNMVSTRGCPFHCNWCAKPIWGQRYAMRSPENVADELAWVKKHLQPDHIWFADDIFGIRPGWVTEFADEVRRRDAVVPFMIQSRADLMTDRAVAALASAGCDEVWMGAESGSQRILDAMDKGTKVEQIAVARRRLGEAGIKASFFLQFGYPGETLDDIMATVQLVRDTLPDNVGISVSYPLPGTKFHAMVREQLGPKTHWVDSNDLAMMFQGPYQSALYRHLHRLVHDELDVRRRLADGLAEPQTLSLLDRVNAGWMEFGRLEVEARSPKPTLLADKHNGHVAAPDLSRGWN
jgi:anaerobic magnesium-protoporphyrin IX monomethyl ester cyclase